MQSVHVLQTVPEEEQRTDHSEEEKANISENSIHTWSQIKAARHTAIVEQLTAGLTDEQLQEERKYEYRKYNSVLYIYCTCLPPKEFILIFSLPSCSFTCIVQVAYFFNTNNFSQAHKASSAQSTYLLLSAYCFQLASGIHWTWYFHIAIITF